MDDIDAFFTEEACQAFLSGVNVDVSGIVGADDQESKKDFAQALMENDDLAYGSLIGDGYENNLKAGKYNKLSLDEVVDIFSKSEMADTFFPKDKAAITDFINDNRK